LEDGVPEPARQELLVDGPRGRVLAMDSAYDVRAENRDRDVVVNASYCGVLPARYIARHRPRASVAVDCGVGLAGAAIAGLWYLEALGIAAAVVGIGDVHLGDGRHVYEHGLVSFRNQQAADLGVEPGMTAAHACGLLLANDASPSRPEDVTNRRVMLSAADGGQVVCVDSIAFGLPEDRGRNVLVTAGHTGRSAFPYLTAVQPRGFICSDGGRGLDDAGIAALAMVEPLGLAGATVDARLARMGDASSTYHDGIISACNRLAKDAGVVIGMPCALASSLLLEQLPAR
jgi:hypothetical protein